MKVRNSLFWFCSFVAWNACASPALLELKGDKDHYELTGFMEHLHISNSGVTIDDLRRGLYNSPWDKVEKGRLNVPLISESEWYRLRIKSVNNILWYLDIDNPIADSLDIYVIQNGETMHVAAGDHYTSDKRLVKVNSFFIPLHLIPDSEVEIYIRIVAKDLTRLPVSIRTIESKMESQSRKNLFYGLFFGWLSVMVLYNIFLFYSTREKTYLFYCFYSLSIGLLIATLEGYTGLYFWPSILWLQEISPSVFSAIAAISSLIFVKLFMNTREKVPTLNFLLTILITWDFISILVVLSGKTMVANLMVQISAMAGSVVIISAAVIILRGGYKPARLFTLGYVAARFGIIIYILGNLGVLPNTALVIAAIPVTASIEVALLSLALADRVRFSKMEIEKAREIASIASAAAKIELEEQIRERTYRISRQNQVLAIQRKALENQKTEIDQQRRKSDHLLLNILPQDVAAELKETGRTKARLFPDVTVLFTDFVNFTVMSEKLGPEKLIQELDFYFREFDRIMQKHGLEKIKTIGDAYLAVGGMGGESSDHAASAVNAALELTEFVRARFEDGSGHDFQLRAGIHSGPVIAGVVGMHKFAFDIWGDTVNTAARMEQNSLPGKVNVSESTFMAVKDRFGFEHRGRIQAKNKGELEMYFVSRLE